MAHGNLAQSAALVGAVGSVLVLLARGRWSLTGGFLALLLAEAGLVVALVPRHDLDRLNTPLHLAGVAGGLIVVFGGAFLFMRYPEVVPVALLVVAPFRLPVNLGGQQAFLLVPLYVVLASASLALVVRSFRGSVPALPLGLAGAAAAFAALLTVVGRSPFARWLPRALAVTLVGLAVVFSVIGLWQEKTRTVFFAHDLRVANTYTTFFRVTSVFKDPSIYGRHLVLAISVLIVLLWLGKVRFLVAAPIIALIFAGLYFSYSQSSMAVLFAMAFLITIAVGDKLSRRGDCRPCDRAPLAAARDERPVAARLRDREGDPQPPARRCRRRFPAAR